MLVSLGMASVGGVFSSSSDDEQHAHRLTKDLAELEQTHGKVLQMIRQGDVFGETELTSSKGVPRRSSTAVTRERCTVLVIASEHYLKTIRQAMADTTTDVIADFLRTFSVFSSWNRIPLLELAKKLEMRKISKGQAFCRQGDAPTVMYFVVEGTCRVESRLLVSKTPDVLPRRKLRCLDYCYFEPQQSGVSQTVVASPLMPTDVKKNATVQLGTINKHHVYGVDELMCGRPHMATCPHMAGPP